LSAAARQQLARIVSALEEHKAIDIVALDLRKVSDATDVFVIASGSSDTHVRALAHHVYDALLAAGDRPHHVEGIEGGRWALLDMVDCVVHVFHPELRQYYQLERLWADASPISIDSLA
jgi:ribosome-associated protein